MVVTAYPVSHRDPNLFSAVPAKAGTQGHTLRSSRLRLLDARFRGQGETLNPASRCDLYAPCRESEGDEKSIPSFPRKRESIPRRTIASAEVDQFARSPARETEGKR
jgi:hypothetical protein